MDAKPNRGAAPTPGDTSAVLAIAGMRLGISCDRPLARIAFDPAYERFMVVDAPTVSIDCAYVDGPLEPPASAVRVFDSQGLWTLFRAGGRLHFVLALSGGAGPYRIASFDEAFERGEIVSRSGGKEGVAGSLMPDPLEFPLGEALTVSMLGRGRGLMVHACGLSMEGRGVLIVGHSGAGKSTIARLAGDDGVVMNEDRIIVTMEDGGPRMYGTPWHGDHAGADTSGWALSAILLIEHAATGSLTPIRGASITAELLSRSFLPVWSPAGLDYTLGLAAGIAGAIPCYRMGFTPDRSVLDLIRCAV